MPDLNKMLSDVQYKTGKIKEDIMVLLRDYEGLLHEANSIYVIQKYESGSDGLEDFYRLIQIIKRNRDVVGSLTRGISNVRPMDKFKFIEEDLEKEATPKPQEKRRQRATAGRIEVPESVSISDVSEPVIQTGVINA
jgi:hypothetical protein